MATQTEDWLGGIALQTIPENIFDTYERTMVPAVFEPWGRRLVEDAQIGTGDRVLDVACATGIVARLAAERAGTEGSVTGLDLMPGMLEVARTASSGSKSTIDWVEGDAGAMALPDDSFDVVLCQQGIQFFPDKVQAFSEMRRVLAKDGRVVISVWRSMDKSPAVAVLQDAIETHAPDAAGFLPFAFSYTSRTELQRSLGEAGFSDVSVRIEIGAVRFQSIGDYLITYLGSTPVGGVIAGLPRERQIALATQVTQALGDYVDDDGFTFPQETHVATARRN
jgi:ubiquinone/menaquinone biosynthesis C-methylase UbiE